MRRSFESPESRDREGIAAQHVHRAIALEVLDDEAAHAVRDDVHPQGRVAVVAPDLLDQLIEFLHRLDVVLAPVVREDVQARFLLVRALARVREAIAARIAQLLHDPPVEILAGRALEDAARHEPVVDGLERLGIDAKREFLVVARQELARAARPELDASVGAGETRAEQARDENDGNAIGRRRSAPGSSGSAAWPSVVQPARNAAQQGIASHANRRRTGSNSE